jgi:hypothetical protein
LIKIPNVDAFNCPLEHRGRLPDSNLVVCTLRSETGAKASKPSSTPLQHLTIAAGAGSSTPEPRVSPIEVHTAGNGNSNHETFDASESPQDAKQPVELGVETKSNCNDQAGSTTPLSGSTSLSTSLVFAASAIGSVVAVRADGDCCFHLCAVLGDLMRDPDAVQSGSTPCLRSATEAARVRIMSNINEYIDLVKSTCVDPSEFEGAIWENFGEQPSTYVPRVTGTAKKEARLGVINDFAAYTAKTPYQVMAVDTGQIWADTPDDQLRFVALRPAEFKPDTEFVKSRVLCVVLHKKHWDLGVVRSGHSIKAVFAAGAEWEAAVDLILRFVKSKAPSRGDERKELCPRWAPPASRTPKSARKGSHCLQSKQKKPGGTP